MAERGCFVLPFLWIYLLVQCLLVKRAVEAKLEAKAGGSTFLVTVTAFCSFFLCLELFACAHNVLEMAQHVCLNVNNP